MDILLKKKSLTTSTTYFSSKNLILILFLGIFTFVSGCRTAESDELPTPTPIPTSIVPTKPTYEVKSGDIADELQFNARVAPVTEEELFFRTSGRIRNVYVVKGDEIIEGQVLADLEILDNLERNYEADKLALRKAEINLENARYYFELYKLTTTSLELQIAEAQLAVAEAEKAVSDAERAFGITQSTADQADIDAAFAQVVLAEENLKHAQEAFDPYQDKPEDNLVRARLQSQLSAAQQAYDTAVRNYNGMMGTGNEFEQAVAAARLDTANAQLIEAQNKLEMILSGSIYDIELALKENDVELAEIALAETKLGMEDLEQALRDAQLTATFDGTVISLGVSEGKTVEAYNTYAVIADLNHLEISADLTGQDLLDLEEGMQVSATIANRPGEIYSGYIRRLPYIGSSTSGEDEDKTTRITLEINPLEANLEVGDLMRVTVILEYKENVLWLPPQAIRTFEGRKFVVVQEGEYQARVDVKLGIEGEDRVEILEGLEEGQIVIGP